MRVMRPLLCLMALGMALLLSACGSIVSATAPPGATQTTTGKILPPEIPELRSGRGFANLLPRRLVIPAIGLNAFVEPVGIRSDGDLATPTHDAWNDTGWYDQGPLPGARGSAVIDGHLDRPGGYPAVFWHLSNIQVGDDVQVVTNGGQTRHFRVTAVAFYAPNQIPSQAIFGNQGGAYLNLITCAGDWIPSQHQTTLRLVVYTTLVA